jgi:hypothetical protein
LTLSPYQDACLVLVSRTLRHRSRRDDSGIRIVAV